MDYLLHSQEVTRDMFDRQIDMIMRDLAPVMQKYAKLLQRIHGFSKITCVLKLEDFCTTLIMNQRFQLKTQKSAVLVR